MDVRDNKLKRDDILYPELSYRIVGSLFKVHNELGYGYQEKYYQRAIASSFTEEGLQFKRELYLPIQYRDSRIGAYFLDFLVEGKIVLEIKKGDYFGKTNIDQIFGYLTASNLRLGILANFTSSGVKIKRILNTL